MENCFADLIGITRNPCDCIKKNLPPGYGKSTSGLYMDEHPYVPFNLQITDSISGLCTKDFATLLTNARDQAYDNFKTDLYKHLQLRFKPKYTNFDGYIGSTSSSAFLNLTAPKIATVIDLKSAKGVTLKVGAVFSHFNAPGTIHISVHKNQVNKNIIDPIPIKEFDLEVGTVIGTKTDLTSQNLVFDAYDGSGNSSKLYFVYDNIGLQPRNFTNSCGCGDKEKVMKSYMSSYGVSGSSLDMLHNAPHTNYINGLNFEVHLSCGSDDIICQARDQNPFLQAAIDATIQKKAVINLLQQVLNSTVINRFTQANREQMHYNSLNLTKAYKNDVQWIAENMSIGLNDCYTCQTENQPLYKTGILN